MEEEEYAIVSKKEFMTLKKEIERLKKHPLEGSESGETLQASIDNLNKSLNVMLEVFKQAAESMKLEEHEAETVGKQLGPLNEKIDTLIDQNQKIAKGIVAIADMVKEKLEEIGEKAEAPRSRLPPLGGGPKPAVPKPAPPPGMPPIGPPPGPAPGGLPPLATPEMPRAPGAGLPTFAPPGAPPAAPPGLPLGPAPGAPPGPKPGAKPAGKRGILGGLMK